MAQHENTRPTNSDAPDHGRIDLPSAREQTAGRGEKIFGSRDPLIVGVSAHGKFQGASRGNLAAPNLCARQRLPVELRAFGYTDGQAIDSQQ
jgi:hypothetical protein